MRFEIIPDAFTSLFKRLGLGGWIEMGHIVRQKLKACGHLRRDDPYDWLEIHPRTSRDLEIVLSYGP